MLQTVWKFGPEFHGWTMLDSFTLGHERDVANDPNMSESNRNRGVYIE